MTSLKKRRLSPAPRAVRFTAAATTISRRPTFTFGFHFTQAQLSLFWLGEILELKAIVLMQRPSYPTETVLRNKLSKNSKDRLHDLA